MPGPFGVCAICKHAEHAFLSDTCERRKIGGCSVDRRLVELEIARMKNRSNVRANREATRARYAVVDVDELRLDIAVTNAVPGFHRLERDFADFMLAKFCLDQRERQ